MRGVTASGFPLIGALTLIFVTLKLAQVGSVAAWSWWWVLSPLWIGFLCWFGVLTALFFALALAEARRQARR